MPKRSQCCAPTRNARNRGRTVTGVWFECSRGGAGMIIRMPSNPRITRAGQKSSDHFFLCDRQDIGGACAK